MDTKATTEGTHQPLVESELRLRRPDRSQMFMEYGTYDDLVMPDHIARVIVRVLGQFNFDAFYIDSRCALDEAGRDGTDARMLAALWLLASVEGIGAAGAGPALPHRCAVQVDLRGRERQLPPAGRFSRRS